MVKSDFAKERKFLIWSVATLAFSGGFRIHELLSRERFSFDITCTLLGKDIVLDEKDRNPHLKILLKTQKSDRVGKNEVVEVFGTDNFFCPPKPYKKYTKYVARISFSAQKPVFRTQDGKSYTEKLFNEDLRILLSSV